MLGMDRKRWVVLLRVVGGKSAWGRWCGIMPRKVVVVRFERVMVRMRVGRVGKRMYEGGMVVGVFVGNGGR